MVSNQSVSNATPGREGAGRRRRKGFVERTLNSLGRRMEHSFYAEELAKAGGLLQRLDPRVKVIGLVLLLIDAALARNLVVMLIIFSVGVTLAILSRVPIRILA